MCGIAGIWNLNNTKIAKQDAVNFTDSLTHRGPDGGGCELLDNETLALGHRRLSILDLTEAGKQPMHFRNRYWITFNGEIYNFLEIREELRKKGIDFKTETDTEVLLAAYMAWGVDCLHKFNGMWAFAIYDEQEASLFMARDRFGVKPLHYIYKENQTFAFASETLAFTSLAGYRKEYDENILLYAMNYSSAIESTGRTIYKDILQLLPGHFILFSKRNKPEQKRWYSPVYNSEIKNTGYGHQLAEFKELFKEACKLRLRSDVTVGSALSGGLDSSSVYGMIHHIIKTESNKERIPENCQKAVVASFPGTEVDEKMYAKEVVDFLKGEAIYTVPGENDIVKELIASTKMFDAISGTPILSISNVYQAMRNSGMVVSMDGHGADELLFGYRGTVYDLFYYYLETAQLSNAEQLIDLYANMVHSSKSAEQKRKLQSIYEGFNNRNIFSKIKYRIKTGSSKKHINSDVKLSSIKLSDWFNNRELSPVNPATNITYDFKELSYPEQLLAKDFYISNIPYNLRDFDRASMQHHIEIRMPFMDYRLVQFCQSLPSSAKIGEGFTKKILRDAMKGLIPESIRTRTYKIGIGAPLSNWFNHRISDFIKDEVNSSSFKNSPYWNGIFLSELASQKTTSKNWTEHEATKFWTILNAHILINTRN